jgi:hypothetical protein
VDALRKRGLHGKDRLESRARLLGRRYHRHLDPVEREQVASAPRRLHLSLHRLDDGVRDLERLACSTTGRRHTGRRAIDGARQPCFEFPRLRQDVHRFPQAGLKACSYNRRRT